MNAKTVVAAVLGGITTALVGYLLHGVVMANTYMKYDQVFQQKQANPVWFFVVGIVVALPSAYLFNRSRRDWAAGAVGGMCFGSLLGTVIGFVNFYWPLVIDGFPYFLSWCWLGIDLITYAAMGAVFGLVIRRTD